MTTIGTLRALRARLSYGETMASSVDPVFADKGKALVASVKPKIDKLLADHPELANVTAKSRKSSTGAGTRGPRGSLAALRAHLTRTNVKLAAAGTPADKAKLTGELKDIQRRIDALVADNPGIEQPKAKPSRTKGENDSPGEVDRQAYLDIHEKKADKLDAAMARLGFVAPTKKPVEKPAKQKKAA